MAAHDVLSTILTLNPSPTEYCTNNSHSNVTVITALFDLTKREGRRGRNIDDYIALGHHLLDLDVNLVVAGDDDVLPKIWAYRKQRGLAHKTYLYTMNLEHSPYYHYHEAISQAHVIDEQLNSYTGNKSSNDYLQLQRKLSLVGRKPSGLGKDDSPLYMLVGWTRYAICAKIAQLNPFNSSHVAWIDYGIFHLCQGNTSTIAQSKSSLLKSYTQLPTNKLRCMILAPTSPNEIVDLKTYYSQQRYKVAGGYLAGDIKSMIWLGLEMELAISRMMSTKHPSLDEITLNSVIVNHPERFDCYYGFYLNIILNSVEYTIGGENIINQLNSCIGLELWTNILHLGCYVLSSSTEDKNLRRVCCEHMITAGRKISLSSNIIEALQKYKSDL